MLRRWPFFRRNDVPVLGAISILPSSQVRQSSIVAGQGRWRYMVDVIGWLMSGGYLIKRLRIQHLCLSLEVS